MDIFEIVNARNYKVVKSNDLVLKTRYDFSLIEQKTLAYICSLIKPADSKNKEVYPFVLDYEFKIKDYINICGISDNGKIYTEIKEILKKLSDKSMWLSLENGSETLVRWISRVTTNKRNGVVKIKLDEYLVPYLFELKSKYLSYGLKNILLMKSQYSIRFYEILKAYYNLRTGYGSDLVEDKTERPKTIAWTLDLTDLKKKFMVENLKSYQSFGPFKQKVLDIAQKEINAYTDINITFQPIKKGRKVEKIKIKITHKNNSELWQTEYNVNAQLDKK